jgi:hypothetical protein
VKQLTGPGLGFGSFWTARRTLAGYEAMTMIRKGQIRNVGDIRAQAEFIAGLFQVAPETSSRPFADGTQINAKLCNRTGNLEHAVQRRIVMPSRPGEFRPEPLTDPDLTLSRHPARATERRLPPSAKNWGSSCCQLARSDVDDLLPFGTCQ